jgi:hypothetical protein
MIEGLISRMKNTPNRPAGGDDAERPADLTAEAKVYAARMRLQDAADQSDALEAIREVVANLLGSEQLALYKVDKKKAALWLYWSFGIDPNKYPVLDVIKEPHVETVLDRKVVVRGDHGHDRLLSTNDPVTALVPILVSGEVAAVLVIFRLLPQKAGFELADRQICEVISNFGGRAIQPYSK